MDEQKKNAGCLWLKTAKTGMKFMAGNVEINGVKTDIVVFKNNKKEKENQPDYNILLGQKRERQPGEEAPADSGPASIGKPPDKFPDDIPW